MSSETPRQPARRAGEVVQGLIIGLLLVPAILQLVSIASGISPFKYQGF